MAKKESNGNGSTSTSESAAGSGGSGIMRAPSEHEAATLAALAAAGFDESSPDGLSEIKASDLRMPLKLYNMKKGEAVNGRVSQDVFFDTIDRTVTSELNLVLLELHKVNAYKTFNNKEQRTDTICTSYDQISGVMVEGGTIRPCKGCPDAQWKTNAEGRKIQPCTEVWNVAAFDLDTQKVVLIKFKRTSLDPIRNHLQAHHINRRPLPGGKRGNIPLFAFRVRMTIAMHKSGNYAVPAIELVRKPDGSPAMLSVDELRMMIESAAAVRETFQERLKASEQDDADSGADTSFDTAAMDAQGERGSEAFVEG